MSFSQGSHLKVTGNKEHFVKKLEVPRYWAALNLLPLLKFGVSRII